MFYCKSKELRFRVYNLFGAIILHNNGKHINTTVIL